MSSWRGLLRVDAVVETTSMAAPGTFGDGGTGEVRRVDGSVRASDGERRTVVERLERALGQGRLSPDEFADRVAAAYAATTRAELVTLTRDLPGHLW